VAESNFFFFFKLEGAGAGLPASFGCTVAGTVEMNYGMTQIHNECQRMLEFLDRVLLHPLQPKEMSVP